MTLPTRWNALVVVLALAALVGCQGFSTGKNSSGPPPGTLAAAPASISFGNVQVTTTQTQSDTLSNTGPTSLTITQSVVTGAGFSTTGLQLPLTLTPGASAHFSVAFTPQTAGSVTGNLALISDASNSTLNIALTATAVTAGDLVASPTSISFGSVQVGKNQSQTETLKNTGGANLTISKVAFTGAAGFSDTGLTLPLTLAPNQSSTFAIVFTPTTAGAANGSLSITETGSSTTLDVALSGTGTTPATLTANPTSLAFTNVQVGQSQTQTETVMNTGGVSATISQATVSGTGFTISGISPPLTLTPGQSTSFSVTFTPKSAGSASGSVVVASDASDPALSDPLSGTAVAPQGTLSATAVNVGSVTVGSSGTQTGTLTASGASVSVTSVSLSGTNGSEFSVTGLSFPVTVTPTTPVNFTVKFTPGATGAASASASFASNASNTPTASALSGTGVAAQGTLSATAVNVGSVTVGTSGTQTGTLTASGASVSVTSVSLSGANASAFAVTGLTFPVTVTTSTPVTFTVKFTPGASGAASASASFASTATNTPTASALSGTGTPAPVHSVSLSWTASTTSGITSYNVYRAVFGTKCGTYSNIGSTASTVTTYTDNVVTDGTTYCYATTAVDANGESGYSNITQAVIPPP
jgi:hypothetical protein